MSSLKEVGAQASAAHLQNVIRTEKRRARASSREDQYVLRALAQQRDQEIASERKRRLMLQDDKKRAMTAAKLNQEAKAVTALLKKRRREIEDAEAVLQTKHAIKQSSLEDCEEAPMGSLGSTRSPRPGLAPSTDERLWLV